MSLRVTTRVDRIIRIVVTSYFVLAALSDLRGSTVVVPGIAPPDASRGLQFLAASVVAPAAILLLFQRLVTLGAIVLAIVYTLRSTWDITGGQRWSVVWTLLLGGLAIIIAHRASGASLNGERGGNIRNTTP